MREQQGNLPSSEEANTIQTALQSFDAAVEGCVAAGQDHLAHGNSHAIKKDSASGTSHTICNQSALPGPAGYTIGQHLKEALSQVCAFWYRCQILT